MTRSNRILTFAGAGVLVALLVGFYLASPIFALQGLTAAAKAGDKAKLERAVDFPAVRESLKLQLKASMTRKIEDDPKLRDNPFAAFGQLLLGGLVDKAVDTYATPDAIATMVATKESPKRIEATPGGAVVTPPPPEKTKAKASNTEVDYAYDDLDHFRVTYVDVRDGSRFDLVLKRHGLFGWKLVEIKLPDLN